MISTLVSFISYPQLVWRLLISPIYTDVCGKVGYISLGGLYMLRIVITVTRIVTMYLVSVDVENM